MPYGYLPVSNHHSFFFFFLIEFSLSSGKGTRQREKGGNVLLPLFCGSESTAHIKS